MSSCTWKEHGGDNLWLLQCIDNAALEGLADGRLQVTERRHNLMGKKEGGGEGFREKGEQH